jgi:exodeoxyribonuclease VII small subunit
LRRSLSKGRNGKKHKSESHCCLRGTAGSQIKILTEGEPALLRALAAGRDRIIETMSDSTDQPPQTGFESGLAELETVVKQLESGDLPLEKALELFERGMQLSENCRKQLEEAETKVEMLTRRGGAVTPEPFK